MDELKKDLEQFKKNINLFGIFIVIPFALTIKLVERILDNTNNNLNHWICCLASKLNLVNYRYIES